MKTLLVELKTSLWVTLVLAVITCGFYPVAVWAVAQLFFPEQANGSLLRDRDGVVRGSRLLAQSFVGDRYFHPRPSSAGSGYDAANSSGSNLGPTSRKLADAIKADVVTYRARNAVAATVAVPADAVTRSGSGLDPHISVANAELQAPRVARVRLLPLRQVRALVRQHTFGPQFGVLGEPGVNVLLLNRALDAVAPPAAR